MSNLSSSQLSSLLGRIEKENKIYTPQEMFRWSKTGIPGAIFSHPLFCGDENDDKIIGSVRFLSSGQMLIENTCRAPGAVLSRFGILTFAVTTGGNAIAVNLSSAGNIPLYEVLYGDHGIFCGRTYFGRAGGVFADHVIDYKLIENLIFDTHYSFEEYCKKVSDKSIDPGEIDFIL